MGLTGKKRLLKNENGNCNTKEGTEKNVGINKKDLHRHKKRNTFLFKLLLDSKVVIFFFFPNRYFFVAEYENQKEIFLFLRNRKY